MGVRMVVQQFHLDGDEQERRKQRVFDRMSYGDFYERTLTLNPGYKTQINTGLSDIQFIYLVANSPIEVFKNLSPESWISGTVFLIFDTSISQLALRATEGAEVYLYLGGVV